MSTFEQDWRSARDDELTKTRTELKEIGERSRDLRRLAQDRQEAVLKALRAFPRGDLSYSQIAGDVDLTVERVRQIEREWS